MYANFSVELFSFDKPNPSGKDNAVKGARGNARKIIACLYGKTADPLLRIGLKFSATIFPLDGNGFFRYHPQIERIYPLSPQFGKILGAVILIIISFGAWYGYCIGGLSYNLPRKVVLSKKNAEVYHAGDRSQKRF